MTVSGSAKLAGIIGWPVSHSLSPVLHNHWLAELGIDGAYVPLPVARENLSTALQGLRLSGFRGVNVTVPHKEAAFALAHECDVEAKAAGAANLLVFDGDGRIMARNTDAPGLKAALEEAISAAALKDKTAIVLGAGGAARAAVRALGELGVGEIRILNRNAARAELMARDLSGPTKAKLVACGLDRWPAQAEGASLVVQATSAGMKGQSPLKLSLESLGKDAVVCDLVYNPLETALLKAARARKLRTIDGLGMLINQAIPAFEAFFGRRPRITKTVRTLLEKALAHG